MSFSARTNWDRQESGFAAAVRLARQAAEMIDLTVSNPTRCGLRYAEEAVLAPLGHPGSLVYRAEPFGTTEARSAVAGYYQAHGAELTVEQLCLTTSTSEAYGFLFQLLCDPGDEVLVAQPSYPLFDFIARLHDVQLREYPLHCETGAPLRQGEGAAGAWSIDFDSLEAAMGARTRAVIVVHPNNPTGHLVSAGERERLEELCAQHGLALIVDEVFLDYTLPGVTAKTFAGTGGKVLCFVLSGVSKVCGLPQMKLSWIAAQGPREKLAEALARLEIIADTYLSLNAPVQAATPAWLGSRGVMQEGVRARLASNLGALDKRLQGSLAQRFNCEGGWTAVVRVPRYVEGEEFAVACLKRSVIVQPGELYGLPPGRAVLSLLTAPEVWAQGLARLPVD